VVNGDSGKQRSTVGTSERKEEGWDVEYIARAAGLGRRRWGAQTPLLFLLLA
jgi:hypothetical protein